MLDNHSEQPEAPELVAARQRVGAFIAQIEARQRDEQPAGLAAHAAGSTVVNQTVTVRPQSGL